MPNTAGSRKRRTALGNSTTSGKSSALPQSERKQVEPLDERDQDRLIQELHQSALEQQEQIHHAFKLLCRITTVIATGCTFWVEVQHQQQDATIFSHSQRHNMMLRGLRWTQHLLSLYLFTLTPRIIRVSSSTGTSSSSEHRGMSSLVGLLSVSLVSYTLVVCLALWILHSQDEVPSSESSSTRRVFVYHHQGLALANFILLGGAFLLQWDHSSTQTALLDLKASRYKFKSV